MPSANEVFLRELSQAIGYRKNVKIGALLCDIARDVGDISLNNRPLMELLADYPDPRIRENDLIELAQSSREHPRRSDFIAKLCKIMNARLGFELPETGKDCPEVLDALSLFGQKAVSHLAHNVGAKALLANDCVLPNNTSDETNNVVRMNLTCDVDTYNGKKTIRVVSSCEAYHLKLFTGQDIGEPLASDSLSQRKKVTPLLTVTSSVALTMENGGLRFSNGPNGVLNTDSYDVKIEVGLRVLQSKDKSYDALRNVEFDSEVDYDYATDAVVDEPYRYVDSFFTCKSNPGRSHLSSDVRHLRDDIMKTYRDLQGTGVMSPFKSKMNHSQLEVLNLALACLTKPTPEKIAELKEKGREIKSAPVDKLLTDAIQISEKAVLDMEHRSSPSPGSSE